MAEDPIRPEEEEYHFSDKPSSNIFDAQAESLEERRGYGLASMLLIGLGIVVLILVLYKSLGIFMGPKQTSQVPTPQITQVPTPVSPPVVATPTTTPEIQTQLTELEQKSSDTQTAVQTLTNDVSSMKSTVADLQSQMSQLNDSIQTLNKSVALSEEQLKVLTTPKVKPIKKHYRAQRASPVWYLQATVPGRAWLTGPHGETLTISIGDSIHGYGKITNIDVKQGIVTTSSGRHIEYSPKDR